MVCVADVLERYVLFTGCAYARSGAPPHRSTIALARALQLDIWEAPNTGCCGARADRRVGETARRQTLEPLYDAARQGLDIVCLSPACRRVVARHAPSTLDVERPGAPRVRDVTGLLAETYGTARLAQAAAGNGLSGLRVALHGTCHADHNVLLRDTPSTEGKATRRVPLLAGLLPKAASLQLPRRERGAGTRTLETGGTQEVLALAELMAVVGTDDVGNVSAAGCCAQHPLLLGLRGRLLRGARSAPCLELAAQAGAHVLVTPCFLCFIGLNSYQRSLQRSHPARGVPVLYVSQLLGLACEVAPLRLELARTTVSARRVLQPFLV
jgi:heterodisulfide reductase subunit B